MSRRKIELNEKVAKLTAKYMEVTDTDFNDLINEALKMYLFDRLNSNQIKDALKKSDDTSSEYTSRLFRERIDDLNRFE